VATTGEPGPGEITSRVSSAVKSIRSASPCTTRTPSGPTVSWSTGTSARSISSAVTEAPVRASARLSAPSPAPISRTWSPGPTRARRAMRSTVFGSTTKFCPRAFAGWMSCSSRRRSVAARPRRSSTPPRGSSRFSPQLGPSEALPLRGPRPNPWVAGVGSLRSRPPLPRGLRGRRATETPLGGAPLGALARSPALRPRCLLRRVLGSGARTPGSHWPR